jgi:argininosuccinate lyase
MAKLWEKNNHALSNGTGGLVEKFTVGNDYVLDQTLLPYDIQASKVHAEALLKAGILTGEECTALKEGLDEILQLWKSDAFAILPEHEDGHTAIEMYLTEKLGDLGKKIHTGRSRNDQVLTAVRLFEKAELESITEKVSAWTDKLLDFAAKGDGVPMPGYTHTRRAMLSSGAQWAGGFAELMIMQLYMADGVKAMIDRSPLGTAAGFGTTIAIDRDAETKGLGFEKTMIVATTAQLSRGMVELQLVQYIAGITGVLNRFASDLILYSSEAFGFFELDQKICTGSSIMPQKKNPDVAELLRGKHALILGQITTLQHLTQNLTSGYHRDLQLTKEPLIKAFALADEMLDAATMLLDNTEYNSEKMEQACSAELLAAEAANKLVVELGWTFRDAYRHIGNQAEHVKYHSISDMFSHYSQLGSPGNVGIERLKEEHSYFKLK